MNFIRKLVSLPYYSRAWFRAMRAAEEKDWAEVARIMESIHDRGLATSESRYWLGCAYACLERWVDAVSEFELVKSKLSSPQSEVRRRYNHAYSLAKAGRTAEAIALLESSSGDGLPQLSKKRVDDLLAHLRSDGVGDLRVLH